MERCINSPYMKVKRIGLKCAYITYFAYFNSVSAMDGDQLVDFYWIDPMVTAERIAAKSHYAGHLYLQFELENHGSGLVSAVSVVSMVGWPGLAILRGFFVCVEQVLNVKCLAAEKLDSEERMHRCLAWREGSDGQW
jgi:hypothetical protein